jgi:predicted Zn-ribbon and HTH transcriptional regulator
MQPIKMTKTRKQECPACGNKINAASSPFGDASPEPGDITICAYCRKVLTFGEAMDLRLATDDEIKEVEKELNQVTQTLKKAYSLINTPNGVEILCHQCGYTSSNPNDVKHRYCGHCHQFLTGNHLDE